MLKETEQTLSDLEKAGFDVSHLRRQITTVPILEAQADNILGKGILRHDAFTRNSQARAEEIKKLQGQIAQLQAAQNAGAGEGTDLYNAALEVINEQQQMMLSAGFSEEEVTNISK